MSSFRSQRTPPRPSRPRWASPTAAAAAALPQPLLLILTFHSHRKSNADRKPVKPGLDMSPCLALQVVWFKLAFRAWGNGWSCHNTFNVHLTSILSAISILARYNNYNSQSSPATTPWFQQLSYYGRAMSQYMQEASPNVTSSSSYLGYSYPGTGQATGAEDGSHSPTSTSVASAAALAGWTSEMITELLKGSSSWRSTPNGWTPIQTWVALMLLLTGMHLNFNSW